MVYASVGQHKLEEARQEKTREAHRRFRTNLSGDKKDEYKRKARERAQKSRERRKEAQQLACVTEFYSG